MPKEPKKVPRPRKFKTRHKFEVQPKTEGQKQYVESIKNNVITLCSGFAGTGKTLLAIGMAMKLIMESKNYSRVIVVRPAIEACGESIGYLPGGLGDKMRPLIQPVIDNLRFFIKDEGFITSQLLEPTVSNGAPLIEVIPMAYLRGRTFKNCIVLFDEAQNATPSQVKLFLTRIGENCKVIIEGDVTQSDKFKDRTKNGLFDAIKRLKGCENVGIVALEATDIQRSSVIAPILERYQDVDGI